MLPLALRHNSLCELLRVDADPVAAGTMLIHHPVDPLFLVIPLVMSLLSVSQNPSKLLLWIIVIWWYILTDPAVELIFYTIPTTIRTDLHDILITGIRPLRAFHQARPERQRGKLQR